MNSLFCLIKEEMNLKKLLPVSMLTMSMIFTLYFFFISKPLQLIIFMITKSFDQLSYYHITSSPILNYLMPLFCLFVIYDSIYKDIREKRIRLICSIVDRDKYILSKLISKIIVILSVIAITSVFISLYSYFSIGISFIFKSINLFLSLSLSAVFAVSIFILISAFSKNPLITSIITYITMFIFSNLDATKKLSFFSYASTSPLRTNDIIIILSITAMVIMVTIHYFRKKQL